MKETHMTRRQGPDCITFLLLELLDCSHSVDVNSIERHRLTVRFHPSVSKASIYKCFDLCRAGDVTVSSSLAPGKNQSMTIYQVVAQCHPLLEEGSGHKKMRMEPTAKAKRLTPLKQRRSYFDSADYFLEAQNLQQDAHAGTQGSGMHQHSTHPTTPLQQQPLPMKLQPCKHTAQPSRLSVRS